MLRHWYRSCVNAAGGIKYKGLMAGSTWSLGCRCILDRPRKALCNWITGASSTDKEFLPWYRSELI